MREAREEARQYMHEFFARLAAHYATLVDDQGLEDPERALAASGAGPGRLPLRRRYA